MLNRIIFITVYFTFFYTPLFAQENLTLEEAIRIALSNNYSILVSEKQLEIADNNHTAGNAGFLPSVDIDGSYTQSTLNSKQEFFDGRTVDRDGARSNSFNTGIVLRWTIFDGLKMFASLNRLKLIRESGEASFKTALENSIKDITSAYYDIVRIETVLEVIRKNIQLSEERLSIAESKRDVGSASKFEVLQAQVDLNEDKASLLREELRLSDVKVKLNSLLGRNVSTDFKVVDSILVNNDLNYDDLRAGMINNNNRIKEAEAEKNISEAELNLSRGDFFPRISFEAGYNFLRSESQAGFIQLNQSHGFNYGVRASFNLFNGLNTVRLTENAKLNAEISKINFEQTVLETDADLLNAYRQYENNYQRILLEQVNLKAAEENVEIALERLKLGTITPLEFREVQRRLLDAQSRLVAAKYDAKTAEVNLLMLSGNLLNKVHD